MDLKLSLEDIGARIYWVPEYMKSFSFSNVYV